jgi:hypothetical protein
VKTTGRDRDHASERVQLAEQVRVVVCGEQLGKRFRTFSISCGGTGEAARGAGSGAPEVFARDEDPRRRSCGGGFGDVA